ncbi:MAG: transposase [Burkholderiaceae bacterium]
MIQRFGSAANLNIHLHCLVLDGVYQCGADEQAHFVATDAPTETYGFSLHAAVRVRAHERGRLEKLCRSITRPAISDERIELDETGQVRLRLKTPWRDGTTHPVMSPPRLMQRLTALVPPPRLHLIRFGVRITSLREVSGPPHGEHGVLEPNAKLRARIVPGKRSDRIESEGGPQAVPGGSVRIGWARLLKRIFDIDTRHCPNCGTGELTMVAPIVERAVIAKILAHLGLDPQPPPRVAAGQRQTDQGW